MIYFGLAYGLIGLIVATALMRAIAWPKGRKSAGAWVVLVVASILFVLIGAAAWPILLGLCVGKRL